MVFISHFKSLMSLKLSIPGILFPCISSKLAPPPVEMKLKLFFSLKVLIKLTESPPPTIEVTPSLVLLMICLITASLPFLN